MISFEKDAFVEYRQWAEDDIKIFRKINNLINEIIRDPFHGSGKPEPLKENLAGHWSRRINQEHRLVYKVLPEHIIITSCKFHYK